MAVSRSAYFKEEIDYPRQGSTYNCVEKEVSFRTGEAIEGATGKTYHENMIPCHIYNKLNTNDILYISRAYRSLQVFVYRADPSDGKIYLENLSFNICVVDELNSFDFVEE